MFVGGGGIWLGRERMARWRALRAVRSEERGAVGEERDLLAGSIWMGRRVNVSSIVGRGGLIALGADGDTNAVESESGEGRVVSGMTD